SRARAQEGEPMPVAPPPPMATSVPETPPLEPTPEPAPTPPPPSAAGAVARHSAPVAVAKHEPAPAPEPLESDWGQQHGLGGHSFLLGTFIPSALVSSHVGIRAGVEYHQVPGYTQLPSLIASGPTAVDLRTINVAETIDFAVRLHDIIGIYGDGYGRARVGA